MDVVVTISQSVWLSWLAEGDLPGESQTNEWALYYGTGGGRRKPSPPSNLRPGDRVYVIAWGVLRGYAPLLRIEDTTHGYALVRGADAVACTVPDPDRNIGMALVMPGFQGVRYRWWERDDEVPFPDWQTRGLPRRIAVDVERLARLRADPVRRAELQRRALAGSFVRPLFDGMP